MADQGHKDGEASLLADERISWKVPVLLNNDWIALRLAKALNPQLPKPLFESVYGCPPCAWAGGRPSKVRRTLEESELRRYFEAYAEVGASCCKYPDGTETIVVPAERRGELVQMGFCDFKLQGRNRKPHHVAAYLVDSILSEQGIEALKDTLRPIMQEAFFLGLFDASVDALISIPKGSCPPPTLSDGSAS